MKQHGTVTPGGQSEPERRQLAQTCDGCAADGVQPGPPLTSKFQCSNGPGHGRMPALGMALALTQHRHSEAGGGGTGWQELAGDTMFLEANTEPLLGRPM